MNAAPCSPPPPTGPHRPDARGLFAAPQVAPGADAPQGTTGTTDAAAHVMTKGEAIVRLCALAFAAEDPDTLRALLLGCKALARAAVHKRRNHASRIARGIHG